MWSFVYFFGFCPFLFSESRGLPMEMDPIIPTVDMANQPDEAKGHA